MNWNLAIYIYIILLKRLSNYRCSQCTARSRRLLKKGKKKKKEASSARGNSINPLYERRSKTGTINNSLPVLSGHPSRRFPPRRRMIYIYTPIEAKSFVTNRLSTDDPGYSTKFRKFRATPCGIIPPPLSLSHSPYREDALIDTRSRRSLNCPRRSFYLHLGKCYTSRCCLISRFQRYSRGGNFQSGASDRQLADPKRSINRS